MMQNIDLSEDSERWNIWAPHVLSVSNVPKYEATEINSSGRACWL